MSRVAAMFVAVAIAAACPGTSTRGGFVRPDRPPLSGTIVDEQGRTVEVPPIEVVEEERTVTVAVDEAATAALGARVLRPKEGRGPVVLIVPGASDVSRKGTRPGDGIVRYREPVDVTTAWSRALASRGATVLSWDKRTCGPNNDPLCAKNPQHDIDEHGPVALAKDVDAACALAKAEPSFDGRLVLVAHGQATQVALSSSCAKEAAAVVLLAPIPRAVDEVMVASARDRLREAEQAAKAAKDDVAKEALQKEAADLRNVVATREAEFAALKDNKFVAGKRFNGATPAYWQQWMALTGKTPALVDAVPGKVIVVLGALDRQYGDKDRVRIRALAPDAYLEIAGADHHLLTGEELADATVDAVGAALDAALAPPAG